ncbi:MAG: glycosyltransferase family A protein [Paracoccaceae bacterium]
MRTIITLSSIPPRFALLRPTLESLVRQNATVEAIRLYIPHSYRRFPDWDGTLPAVPGGVTIVRTSDDPGPATKILPALRETAGQDVDILFCDDDRIYDPDWATRFQALRRQRPRCALAEAGWDIRDIPLSARRAERLPRAQKSGREGRYRLKRIFSLGLWKPARFATSGYVDVLAGYGGVMVKPDFFTPAVFDIPEPLWTVDDPWLSGNLELNGIPIWLNAAHSLSRERSAARRESLLKFGDGGLQRGAANRACVAWYRQNHGIWQAETPAVSARSPARNRAAGPA